MKSELLAAREATKRDRTSFGSVEIATSVKPSKHIIKPVACLNEFVAVKVFKKTASVIVTSTSEEFEDKGIIVGVNGSSALSLGDVVMLTSRGVAATMNPQEGHYAGEQIRFYSETSLICKLDAEPFEVLEGDSSCCGSGCCDPLSPARIG